MRVPIFLTSKQRENAISLEHLGVYEYAWKEEDALKVIEHCLHQSIPILGGDVLRRHIYTQDIEYTYDNWYITAEEDDNIIEDSCKYAKNRVEFYSDILTKPNSEWVPLFVLVFGGNFSEE